MKTTFRLLTAAAALLAIGASAHAEGGTGPAMGQTSPASAAAPTAPPAKVAPTTPAVSNLPAPTIAVGEPRPDHPRGPAEFLTKADANKDGKVSKEEFISASAERAQTFFSRMDKNGDGFLTEDEAPKARHMPPRPPEPPRY